MATPSRKGLCPECGDCIYKWTDTSEKYPCVLSHKKVKDNYITVCGLKEAQKDFEIKEGK